MFQQRAQQNRTIPGAVATVGVNERVAFLRRTYAHLGGAILAFIAIEFALLSQASPLYDSITMPLFGMMARGGGGGWLFILALFMGGSYIANKWAMSDTSELTQYMGLGLYVLLEAVIFVPILLIANHEYPGTITDAAVLSLFIFAGLTAVVFITKKDFSFMRGALTIAGFGAMGLIVASVLFKFHLGTIFSGAMILFAAGYILYYTSNVVHHYRPTQHVAASLALFSALALLFWYILRILMALRD